MSCLFRYISKKFWGPFFFAVGVCSALVVLGDTFEKLKKLGNGYATLGAILHYSLLTFPSWLTTIMPVACLLGSISVVSEMVANGEWTACVASGFSPKQLFKPIVICIISVAAVTMLFQEFVVPPLNLKANILYYSKIKPAPFQINTESDVAIKISTHQMLYAKLVDLENAVMQDVSVDTYNDNWNIVSQVVARRLVWDPTDKEWVYEDGTLRTFTDQTGTQDIHFDTAPAPLTLAPSEMSISSTDGKLMSLRELNRRISFFKRTGLVTYVAETQRQSKLSTPFVTVIMCLLGMPFAISTRRKSKILNIIASMVIAFTFWWLMSMVTSLGENGYVNPFLAGWGLVLIFSVVIFFEFKWLKL